MIYAFLSITPLILNLEHITLYPTRIVFPMLGDTCCSPKTVIVETKTDLKVLQCVHTADGGRHVDTLVPTVVVVVPNVAVGGLTALLVRLQVVNDLHGIEGEIVIYYPAVIQLQICHFNTVKCSPTYRVFF